MRCLYYRLIKKSSNRKKVRAVKKPFQVILDSFKKYNPLRAEPVKNPEALRGIWLTLP